MHAMTASNWPLVERRSEPRRGTRSWTFAALTAIAAVLVVALVLQLERRGAPSGGGNGGVGKSAPIVALPTVNDGDGEGAKTEPKVEEPKTVAPKANEGARWGKTDEELAAMPRAEREAYHRNLKTPYIAVGDHIRLYTTHGMDFGDRMLVTAEAAYRRANQFFGTAPKMEEGQTFHVFVVSNTDEYNELGGGWNGDEKSSAFYAFSTPWLKGAMSAMPDRSADEYADMPDLATVTLFSQQDSLTEIYVTHATVEQFVRRLIGEGAADAAPRWFIDGVSSYIERWQQPALFDWSRGRLGAIGGTLGMKTFLGSYSPNEQNILSSGALIAFLKSDACPDDLRSSFQSAVVAVNDGKKVQKTFRALEKDLVKHEDEFKDYVNL